MNDGGDEGTKQRGHLKKTVNHLTAICRTVYVMRGILLRCLMPYTVRHI